MTRAKWAARLLATCVVLGASSAEAQDTTVGERENLTSRAGPLAAWSKLFHNPVPISLPDGGVQTNCADPTLIREESGDGLWYVVCTTDALRDEDVAADGTRSMHLLPTLRSRDLVSWEYVGNAFPARPAWAAETAGLWAPELVFRNGRYYLYYGVTDVADAVSGEAGCTSDSAIGVATSDSPVGPWTDAGGPIVAPRRAGPGCSFYASYDPDVLLTATGEAFLYYGSYYGGIEVRALSADGQAATPQSARAVTIPNRYEAPEVIEREGHYYLLASASNCCNGPLTGYQVFAGRADSPLGPFVDRAGTSLLDARVGGTPVLTLNGNGWVGAGHQTLFQDVLGDWYAAYHAVDRDEPYFENAPGYTRRPLLIDRVTWDGGWPEIRHGLGASRGPQLPPLVSAAPEERSRLAAARRLAAAFLDLTDPAAFLLLLDVLDVDVLERISGASDEFDASALSAAFRWVRPPAAGGFGVADGVFSMATQDADLFADRDDASVLTLQAPEGNYLVETKLELDLPDTGCCQNYVQGALLVYADDDTYVKLSHVSIWETRQTEFAKEVPAPTPGYPAYGSGVGGAPGRTTWLRIAKVTRGGHDQYVAFTSRDGVTFTRGPVWTHALGAAPRIGLAALGGAGYTARFDYVRTYRLPP